MSSSTNRLVLQIFLPFSAAYLIASIFRSINSVIGTDIVAELGASATDLGFLTSAFFVAAILTQLPLGIALDRYGPRRVGISIMCLTALGGFVFAMAPNVTILIIGRAMIGLGVAAGMPTAFKAFSHYFSADRVPALNGLGLAAGGIGLMAGTWPVEAALAFTDWRGVVLAVSAMTALMAVMLSLVVPEGEVETKGETLGRQIAGFKIVFSNADYWRFAPLLMISTGAYAGITTLWSGPWLRDVAGFDRMETASTLFLVAATTVVAMPLGGYIATRLNRIGISTMNFVIVCALAFTAVLVALFFQWLTVTKLIWLMFGFFGLMPMIAYADIGQKFPKKLTGRVNATLTLLWMVGAFLVQSGIGAILDLYPRTVSGGYGVEGYQMAIGIIVAVQISALMWYWLAGVFWQSRIEQENAFAIMPD